MISLLSKSKMSQLRSIRLLYICKYVCIYCTFLTNLRDSRVNEFKIEIKNGRKRWINSGAWQFF